MTAARQRRCGCAGGVTRGLARAGSGPASDPLTARATEITRAAGSYGMSTLSMTKTVPFAVAMLPQTTEACS